MVICVLEAFCLFYQILHKKNHIKKQMNQKIYNLWILKKERYEKSALMGFEPPY